MKMDELGKIQADFINRKLEVFTIYKNRNNANKHKMIPIPVCKIPKEYL